MTRTGRSPWHVPAALVLLAMAAVLVLSCGCTQQVSQALVNTPTAASPAPIQEGKMMVTFTEKDNGTTADVGAGTRFAVQLRENPTTGYSWNVSASPGLTMLSSDYLIDKHAEGMVGVGGTHTWILRATGTGDQTFTGVYKQPWMPTTGNETGYSLAIRIVPI